MASNVEWEERLKLQDKSAAVVLAELPENIREYAYLVGAWVWVEFETRPEQSIIEALKAMGFLWNPKRKVWQHPGGRPSRHSAYDPRDKYGIFPANEAMKILEREAAK